MKEGDRQKKDNVAFYLNNIPLFNWVYINYTAHLYFAYKHWSSYFQNVAQLLRRRSFEILFGDAVLGKVKDFLGVMSEANKRLELDAKVKSGFLIESIFFTTFQLFCLSTFFLYFIALNIYRHTYINILLSVGPSREL